jgi:pilus assembly protein CpaB
MKRNKKEDTPQLNDRQQAKEEVKKYNQPSQVRHFFSRPNVLGATCIIVAVAVGLLFVPSLLAAQNDTVDIVVAKTDIAKGDHITKEMLGMSTILASSYSEGAYLNTEEVEGQFAKSFIYEGDTLTINKVDTELQYSGDISDATKVGKLVYSVPLKDLASSVSGKLKPGDIVSVLTANTITDSTKVNIPSEPQTGYDGVVEDTANTVQEQVYEAIPELRYIEVCGISTATGAETSGEQTAEGTTNTSIPATITLFVTEDQALRLFKAQKMGDISFAFVAKGEDRYAFVEAENLVIK